MHLKVKYFWFFFSRVVSQWTSVPCVYHLKRMFSPQCPCSEEALRENRDWTASPLWLQHSNHIGFKGKSSLRSSCTACVCVHAQTHTERQKPKGSVHNFSIWLKSSLPSDRNISLCKIIHRFHDNKPPKKLQRLRGWLSIHPWKKEHQLNSIKDTHQGPGGFTVSFEFFSLVWVSFTLHKNKTAFNLMFSSDWYCTN